MLVDHVIGEGRIGELDASLREPDHPASPILSTATASHQSRSFQPIDPLRRGSRGHHRVLRQLGGCPFVWGTNSPQRHEHVELTLGQAVLSVDGFEFGHEQPRKAVKSADDSLGRRVNVGPFAAPLPLDDVDVILGTGGVHPFTIPSEEGIVSSVETTSAVRTPRSQGAWRWILLTAIAPIAWGSTYVVTHSYLPADSPLWGAALRALPAGLVLLVLVRRLPQGSWWWKSLVLGTLNVGAFFVLLFIAAQTLPSSVASSIMAASPVAMMLMAWMLISERPSVKSLVGALLGIGGVALIVTMAATNVNWWGVGASVTAMLMSALGFVLAKRWNGQVPVLASTAWQVAAGGLVLLVVALIFEGAPPSLNGPAILGFAYVSLIATALAYVAWFAGLARLRAGTVGIIGLLNPVSGVLLGTMMASERIALPQIAGIALVISGILVAAPRGSSKEPAQIPAARIAPAA